MIVNDFIGIPFVDKGRDIKGCDCYGLIKLYYKEILNIDIPDVLASPNQPKLAYMEYLANTNKYWSTSQEMKENSIVAMCTDAEHPKMITHYGIIIKVDNKLKMLHTFKNVQSHLVDLPNLAYDNKIKAYHEWLS